MKVFVGRRFQEAGIEKMRQGAEVVVNPHDRSLTPEELIECTEGFDVLASEVRNRIDAKFLAARPNIRMVANCAVGLDNIDLAACREAGVKVSNTPDVLSAATADMTILLMLAVMRRLLEGDKVMRAGQFKGVTPFYMLGHDTAGKVMGIYGMGRIGLAVAQRARAFGMSVIYHNRNRDENAERLVFTRLASFEELLAESDVISINAPLTPQTTHAFDLAAFKAMKTGAYIVNTGRGPIIKEEDLALALRDGLIAGAGLDVYEKEPVAHPDLLALANVVMAPHLGSATHESRTALALMVADNVLAFVRGEEPPQRVA